MYRGNVVGVVVPAYNEAGFVGEVLETMPAFVDRVYVVDDCSTDGTWAEIRETLTDIANVRPVAGPVRPDGGADATAAADESVLVYQTDGQRFEAVRHAENSGVGAALSTGYRRALADGVDVTAVMNGDGQMDPAILDRILDPVVRGQADYAKGNRLRYAEYRREMSGLRTFGNFLLTHLTRVASGYWGMMDPQNGYTAISRRALSAVDLDATYDGYGFCNDLLVRLNAHGFRIADVPMRAVYGDETSHIDYSTFVPTLSLLLARRYLWRLTHGGAGRGRTADALQVLGLGLLLVGVPIGVLGALAGGPAGAAGGGGVLAAGAGLYGVGLVADGRRNAGLTVQVDRPELQSDAGLGAERPHPSDDTTKG